MPTSAVHLSMANNSLGVDAARHLQDLLLGTDNVEDFLGRLAEFSAATLSRTTGAEIECGAAKSRRIRSRRRRRG